MRQLVEFFSRLFVRWIPDAFVIAVLLSLLTFFLAVTVAGYPLTSTIESWGDSFWNLLEFTNQITLTLLFGYALANTPPVRKLLLRAAGVARSAWSAYILACVVTGIAALFSWGLSLIAAGIMARAIGESCKKKGIKVHYPLLVASSFSGFVVWHQGLSSSIGLVLATPGHFLEDLVGIIPISQTLFTPWNAVVALVVLATLPFVMAALRPRGDESVDQIPDRLVGGVEERESDEEASTPARRMERSVVLNLVIIAAGAAFLWFHFIVRDQGLELNVLNFSFLVVGLLLAGSPIRYVDIIVSGGRVAVPFLLQYPFYAGIAGVMADSGLAALVVEFFVSFSSASSLPFFSFLSGGLLNIFVPSGGGQWAVQGPIMMSAALRVDAEVARVAMGVALGDQWTNLIQPLAIIPVLTIAGLKLREIMAYLLIALLWSGLLFAMALLIPV